MRRSTCLFALSTLGLAAGCSDDGGDGGATNPEPFVEIIREAVLTEEAYFLEGVDGVQDLRVDGARLIFTAAAAPEGLVPGAVVLGAADGGYVRRVLSVEAADGVVTVQTEIASPGDFFEDIAIRFRPELVQAQALTAEGYAIDRRAVSTSVGLSWSPKNRCVSGGVELPPDRLPDMDFDLHVSPIFEVDKVDGEVVVSVGLEGSVSADVQMSGPVQGSLRCSIDSEDVSLAKFPVTTLVPTPIGPVPLRLVFKAGPTAFGEISLSANADVSVRAQAQGSLQLAVDYEWGGDAEARDTGATADASLEYDLGDTVYALSMATGGGLKFEVELYGTVSVAAQAAQTTRRTAAASPVTCTVSRGAETTLDVSLGVDAKLPLVVNSPKASASVSESWPLQTEGPVEDPIPGCTPSTGVLAKVAQRLECAKINPYMQGLQRRHVVYASDGRTEDSEETTWFAIETPNCFGESYMLEPSIGANTFTLRWHKVLNDWTRDWTLVGTLAPDEQSLTEVRLDYAAMLDSETHPQTITAQLVLSNVALDVDNDRMVAFEGTFGSGMGIETMSYRSVAETWTTSPTGLELYFTEERTISECNEDFATTKFELDLRLEDP